MKPVKLAVLASLCVPSVAVADPKNHAGAAMDPDKRVCRSVESTGSRFAKKTCYTRAQWVEIDRGYRAEANEAIRMRRADAGLDQAPH